MVEARSYFHLGSKIRVFSSIVLCTILQCRLYLLHPDGAAVVCYVSSGISLDQQLESGFLSINRWAENPNLPNGRRPFQLVNV